MSGPATTHIPGAQGQFHTGTGDFISIETAVFQDSKGRSPRAVARDELLHLYQRYVYPPGFGRARAILGAERTVLLHGLPGDGRNAAARMLLYELRDRARPQTFRELLPDEEDSTSRLPLDQIGDGDLLLLDLSSVDEQRWRDIHSEISALREAVCRQEAHLVVVLPHARTERLRNELEVYRCDVTRPREEQVIRRYLRLADIPVVKLLQFPSALSDFLSGHRSLDEIAAFAGLVVRARDNGQASDGFSEWCAHARAASDDWGKDVARLVAKRRTGPERALLLATAMLHGSHADVVERGAAALLRTTEYPEDDCPLLERPHLLERFEAMEVTPTTDGTVRFGKVDFDKAVRRHFWDHVPGLRAHLRDWTIATVARPELSDLERDRLVERFSRECLRAGHLREMVTLVLRCTSAPAGNARLRAAARTLEHGLDDGRHAQVFRQNILNWSKTFLSRGFANVLILVCAEIMSVHHPDQAVVRLHHLARRERDGTAARDALLELVRNDRRLHRLMPARLVRALPQGAWPVDTDLFLDDLTDPAELTSTGAGSHPLLAERGVRSGLSTGWNAVFDRHPHHRWEEQVRRWFTTASEDQEHADLLLDVLVDAAERRGGVLARLYVTARHWAQETGAHESGSRDTLVTRLFQKINAAQGLCAA